MTAPVPETVAVPAGRIEYFDSGAGPAVLFLHGAMKDATVWDEVVRQLPPGFRYLRPTLPLGAHRLPMRPGADLTVPGLAALVDDFCAALDLDEVVLVQNHWGAAQVMLATGTGSRLRAIAAIACEAFDNYPPGAPGRAFARTARLPGAFAALGWAQRQAPLRRLLAAGDVTTERPIPPGTADRWLRPFGTDPAVRRDVRAILADDYAPDRLAHWAAAPAEFPGPALVVWAGKDRLMPRDHGPRLAATFPDADLVEIADSGTCVPWDRPDRLAAELSLFLTQRCAR